MHQLRVSWPLVCKHWGSIRDQSTCSGGTALGRPKIGYNLLVFSPLLFKIAHKRILERLNWDFYHKFPFLLEFCLLSLAKFPIKVLRQTSRNTGMHHNQVLFTSSSRERNLSEHF